MKPRGGAVLIACLVGVASLPVQAHKLKVFAAAEGDRIEGEVYFAGGAKAAGAAIAITDAQGHELARLVPDTEGRFSYRVDRRSEYRVVADSRDGHVASWTIRPEELSSGLPEAAPPEASAGPRILPSSQTPAQSLDVRESELSGIVESAVARQVRPLREALLAYDDRARLHDILGGIGYIAGIAGLGLWWRSRREAGRR